MSNGDGVGNGGFDNEDESGGESGNGESGNGESGNGEADNGEVGNKNQLGNREVRNKDEVGYEEADIERTEGGAADADYARSNDLEREFIVQYHKTVTRCRTVLAKWSR